MTLKYKFLLGIFALAGSVLILITTSRYGAGLSPDSVAYIGTARNLIKGVGFINYDGKPTMTWPPFYPALLALPGWISGTDPLSLTNVINALIFGLIVLISGTLLFRHFSTTPIVALLGTLAILGSTPLFDVSVMAWSEPLFILFSLLSFIFLDTYLLKKDTASLILLSLSVTLAALTRYIGISLIAWGGLIVLVNFGKEVKKRFTHFVIFILISTLPLGIWLIRNFAISGTFAGDRAPTMFTLSQNLSLMSDNLLKWYIPGNKPTQQIILFVIVLLIILSFTLNFRVNWQGIKGGLRNNSPTILFILIYILFLILSLTTIANDQINSRLLSPIYIPLTIFLLVFVQALFKPLKKHFSEKTVNAMLTIFISIWLIYPLRSTILDSIRIMPTGLGYSAKDWIHSETAQYLLQHQQFVKECTLYTNDQPAAYLFAHLSIKRSPAKTRYNSPEIVNEISSLKGTWPTENNACLVWFNKISRGFLYSVQELQTIANLNLVVSTNDGAIYTMTRK